MTEINDSPFIKDKEYLFKHDLCDIPGLTENQSENINSEIIENIQMNELNFLEDDIYYETHIKKNTYLCEIFGIIKYYIDEAIIIFNVQNYQIRDNYELIAKFHRVIEKELSNCLILLNKLDLSTNPEQDKESCKGLFIDYFPKFKTFNLYLNTFIALSLKQVQNELLLNESFSHLIYYHFYNYYSKFRNMQGFPNNKPFIDYLRDKVIEICGYKKNEINTKVNDLNESENISEINKEIISIKEYLSEKYGYLFYWSDFRDDLIEEKEVKSDSDEEENFDYVPDSFIIKILYIFNKEKQIIPPISRETKDFLNYFQNNRKKLKLENINYKNEKKGAELEEYLTSLCNILKKSKIDVRESQILIDEINDTLNFVNFSKQIFIPFLGLSNAGKTTIINGIIGRNILPTSLEKCTKRAIIISYSDQEDDEISIYKSSFKKRNCFEKSYYYLNKEYIIGKGLNQIHDLLKVLNCDFTGKSEDFFYLIKTKIKLFDELGLDDSLKRKIYLIDFPGYPGKELDYRLYESQRYSEGKIDCTVLALKIYEEIIVSISRTFIIVLRNYGKREEDTERFLCYIFKWIQNQNEISNLSMDIKSFFFLINEDNFQIFDDNLEYKKSIQHINNKILNPFFFYKNDINNINFSVFNAKYYCDYIHYYNYFFNLEETFENEYNNFLDSGKKIVEIKKINNSFFSFLKNELQKKN